MGWLRDRYENLEGGYDAFQSHFEDNPSHSTAYVGTTGTGAKRAPREEVPTTIEDVVGGVQYNVNYLNEWSTYWGDIDNFDQIDNEMARMYGLLTSAWRGQRGSMKWVDGYVMIGGQMLIMKDEILGLASDFSNYPIRTSIVIAGGLAGSAIVFPINPRLTGAGFSTGAKATAFMWDLMSPYDNPTRGGVPSNYPSKGSYIPADYRNQHYSWEDFWVDIGATHKPSRYSRWKKRDMFRLDRDQSPFGWFPDVPYPR